MTAPGAPVVIAGSGVAGAGLALALHRAGIDAVVCEAHEPGHHDSGAFLTLAPTGVLALRAIGAEQAVVAVSDPVTRMRMLDTSGTPAGERALGDAGDPAFRLLTRFALTRTLERRAAELGVEVRYGHRIRSAVTDANGVTVALDDGSELRGALLVGADGLRSTVRTLIDPASAPPRPVGQRIYYGFTPRRVLPDVGDFHVLRTGAAAFGVFPTSSGETWWFARVDRDPVGDTAPPVDPDPAAALLALLGPHGPATEAVREASAVLSVDAHDLPRVGRWSRDRTVLVGDAAHAASPATGQGAAMALEDVVVLAKALRTSGWRDDPGTALDRFERARRPRTQAAIVASARHGRPDLPLDGVDPGRTLSSDDVAAQLDWDRALA